MASTYTCIGSVTITVRPEALMEFRQRGRGRHRYSYESRSGPLWRSDGGGWVRISRVIDRQGNRYFEHVEDRNTGDVLRHIDQPLSSHVGRGSARRPIAEE
jgi:hypothetical protein